MVAETFDDVSALVAELVEAARDVLRDEDQRNEVLGLNVSTSSVDRLRRAIDAIDEE